MQNMRVSGFVTVDGTVVQLTSDKLWLRDTNGRDIPVDITGRSVQAVPGNEVRVFMNVTTGDLVAIHNKATDTVFKYQLTEDNLYTNGARVGYSLASCIPVLGLLPALIMALDMGRRAKNLWIGQDEFRTKYLILLFISILGIFWIPVLQGPAIWYLMGYMNDLTRQNLAEMDLGLFGKDAGTA